MTATYDTLTLIPLQCAVNAATRLYQVATNFVEFVARCSYSAPVCEPRKSQKVETAKYEYLFKMVEHDRVSALAASSRSSDNYQVRFQLQKKNKN